jgi:hypothetical protein
MAGEQQVELNAEVAGQKFDFKGTSMQLLTTLLFVVCSGVICYFLYQIEAKAETRGTAATAAVLETKVELEKSHDIMERKFRAMIYVNWICAQSKVECARLNLAKPQDLRDMERN